MGIFHKDFVRKLMFFLSLIFFNVSLLKRKNNRANYIHYHHRSSYFIHHLFVDYRQNSKKKKKTWYSKNLKMYAKQKKRK